MRFCSALILVGVLTCASTDSKEITRKDVLAGSIQVCSEGGFGSGVLTRNGSNLYCWTAGHVVRHNRQIRTVLDPETGQERKVIEFADCRLLTEDFQNGRKVGDRRILAKVIRYSATHDLALLLIYRQDQAQATVQFSFDIPEIGASIWHVGSMGGPPGVNSFAEGVFSTAGRLIATRDGGNDLAAPVTYDQVTIPALPGSSGGGVFLKNGLCIGLLTRGVTAESEAPNLIVPSRRMKEYAKESDCLWALGEGKSPETHILVVEPILVK